MRITAGCDYACRALLELSRHWPKETPLQIQQISQHQSIPMKYLVQILIQLKREGLIASFRGKAGGYKLTKSPEAITLGRVIRCMGGALLPKAESAQERGSPFKSLWDQVEGAMAKIVDNVSFADILKQMKKSKEVIIYQI